MHADYHSGGNQYELVSKMIVPGARGFENCLSGMVPRKSVSRSKEYEQCPSAVSRYRLVRNQE
jgi:hypothetical protein